jgi:lipopolysaccharide/colanic/teichoic acid biosynthesis glycosyltransferase
VTPRDIVAPEPAAPASQAAEQAREPTLVERYRAIAHEFQPRPIDHVLRALDLLLGGLVLAAVSPLLLACGLAVLASGGAPILYRGARVGRNGEVFAMYKLRTLRPGAEERLGPYYGEELTLRTERELTLVGRGLRALKLDELPQLYNVVRGDMSMVGPRPIRPTFFEELCETIPAYWQRLVVRPGMTGLAQLRLSREMTWDEKLAHDFEFIADRSVGLYLAVLAQTAGLLAGRLLGRR